MPDDADAALRRKALACLREGRVSVIYSRTSQVDVMRVTEVIARVQSSQNKARFYAVDLLDGAWRCTCDAGKKQQPCPHETAVRLVTTGVAP